MPMDRARAHLGMAKLPWLGLDTDPLVAVSTTRNHILGLPVAHSRTRHDSILATGTKISPKMEQIQAKKRAGHAIPGGIHAPIRRTAARHQCRGQEHAAHAAAFANWWGISGVSRPRPICKVETCSSSRLTRPMSLAGQLPASWKWNSGRQSRFWSERPSTWRRLSRAIHFCWRILQWILSDSTSPFWMARQPLRSWQGWR